MHGRTRRAVLGTAGLALTAGLAGCESRYDPAQGGADDEAGEGGGSGTTPGEGGGGGAADGGDGNGDGNGDGSGDGGGDGSGDATGVGGSDGSDDGSGGSGDGAGDDAVPADACYDPVAVNSMEPTHLGSASDVGRDAAASASLAVERHPPEGEAETIFERTVALRADQRREFPDAFATEPGGTQYIVRARLTSFRSLLP